MPTKLKPKKIQEAELAFEWSMGDSACAVIRCEASFKAQGWPIGSVWFRRDGATGGIISILTSYVDARFRRRGVRTLMHKTIMKWYPDVVMMTTPQGTEEGTAWLKANGFKNTPVVGWVLKIKKAK